MFSANVVSVSATVTVTLSASVGLGKGIRCFFFYSNHRTTLPTSKFRIILGVQLALGAFHSSITDVEEFPTGLGRPHLDGYQSRVRSTLALFIRPQPLSLWAWAWQ